MKPSRWLLLFLSIVSWTWGDPPVSAQTSPAPLGPKETILSWNFDDKTVDQVRPWYQATTEEEKKFTEALIAVTLSTIRLAKVVREKWGPEAAIAMTHAFRTDTPEDDKAATVAEVDADHATVKCNVAEVPDLLPLYLVRVEDNWRLDMATYVREYGDQVPTVIKFLIRCTGLADKITVEVSAGKYATAEAACDAARKGLAALDEEQ